MNSFYGGRSGFSFVISKSYPSVAAMVADFSKGPEFSAVHFNEYVLIDTENKNSDENGRIYRRGYDYTGDLGGAQYVGSIVGPAGSAPMLTFTTIEDVESKKAEGGEDNEHMYNSGSYTVPTSLIPGKVDDEERYNDEIKWASYCVRNEDGTTATAYIGFAIPYPVIDFIADAGDAYTTENLAERQDEKDHPFYEKWHITIPRGIKGDALKNLRVIPATEEVDYGEHEANKTDDVEGSREVLVYDYYNYDENGEVEPVTIYLGDYNIIKDVTLDTDGTFTIKYHHEDEDVWQNIFKWIDSVELDATTGKFTVTYNQEGEKYETYLDWVENILFNDNGTITLQYSHSADTNSDTVIKWISDVTLDDTGTLTVTFNDGSEKKFENIIRWITKVELTEDGDLTVEYNNGEDSYSAKLNCLTDVTIETDSGDGEGSGDQKVHVSFNTGVEKAIGEPLNYIMKMATTDDYHLIAKYSDPVRRAALAEEGLNYKGQDGTGYNKELDWIDFGSIKDDDGILIGLNVEQEFSSIAEVIEHLKQEYPDGLKGDNLTGKIVSVGVGEEEKSFYGFDYSLNEDGTYKGWYYLGKFLPVMSNQIIVVAEESEKDKIDKLETDGVWFKIEDNITIV